MKTEIKNTLYPVQLWLTSMVVVAPVLLIFIGLINDVKNAGIETILTFIIFGVVLSLPVLLICLIVFKVLIQKISSANLIKIVLALITMVGILVTFFIISGSMAYMLALLYSTSVIISSLFFRIDKQ